MFREQVVQSANEFCPPLASVPSTCGCHQEVRRRQRVDVLAREERDLLSDSGGSPSTFATACWMWRAAMR